MSEKNKHLQQGICFLFTSTGVWRVKSTTSKHTSCNNIEIQPFRKQYHSTVCPQWVTTYTGTYQHNHKGCQAKKPNIQGLQDYFWMKDGTLKSLGQGEGHSEWRGCRHLLLPMQNPNWWQCPLAPFHSYYLLQGQFVSHVFQIVIIL